MPSIVPTTAGPTLPVPDGFERDVLDRTWTLDRTPDDVWAWLCDPATFTDSQVPPWRVEFVDPASGRPAGVRPSHSTALGPAGSRTSSRGVATVWPSTL